tara:strand:+ start:733 stop:1359 length:627 start_codon:yes stop_codon:yes gene_type:complete
MECSICLEQISENDTIKTLSCNHQFHYHCFLSYAMKTSGVIFVQCPLCREMNTNNDKPYDNPKQNILALCETKKATRCKCITKKGRRCKKKAAFLNYQYCTVHNSPQLPPEKYELMCDHIYYTLETSNKWCTKILMIDITKKLLIQNPHITKINEIHYYFLRYYHWLKSHGGWDGRQDIPSDHIYDYYHIEKPPKEWIRYCVQNRVIR